MEKEIIFFCEPKNFPTPSNAKGFNIEGVSCNVSGAVAIGNDKIPMVFSFYTKDKEGNFSVYDQIGTNVDKAVTIPNVGIVPIPSMLLNNNKATMYQAATVMGAAYGYALLPYEEQTQLLES